MKKLLPLLLLLTVFACKEEATTNAAEAETANSIVPTEMRKQAITTTDGQEVKIRPFDPSPVIENGSELRVNFNGTLTEEDLNGIKEMMAKRSILIDFKETRFNQQGKLNGINFGVQFPNRMSGTGSFFDIKPTTKFGFVYDPSNTGRPVLVGEFE